MIPFTMALHGAVGSGGNVCWCAASPPARGLTRDELVTALLGDKVADLPGWPRS